MISLVAACNGIGEIKMEKQQQQEEEEEEDMAFSFLFFLATSISYGRRKQPHIAPRRSGQSLEIYIISAKIKWTTSSSRRRRRRKTIETKLRGRI
jgi:hypothetical protein